MVLMNMLLKFQVFFFIWCLVLQVYGSPAGNFREGFHHWKNRSGIGCRKTGSCYEHLNLSIDISFYGLWSMVWVDLNGREKLDCRLLNYGYTAHVTGPLHRNFLAEAPCRRTIVDYLMWLLTRSTRPTRLGRHAYMPIRSPVSP